MERDIRSKLSECLMRYYGWPAGWTLCGVLGLQVLMTPRVRIACLVIDVACREREHCANAVDRSIERAALERRNACIQSHAEKPAAIL